MNPMERYWAISNKITLLEAEVFELKKEKKAAEKAMAEESKKLQYQFDLTEEKLTDH